MTKVPLSPDATLEVLLVEDNDDDVLLLTEALASFDYACTIVTASDGMEALQALMARQEDRRRRIVLVDLNMPGLDGFALIEHLRASKRWSSMPLVVLTTSDREEDVRRAYALGASAYHVKPAGIVRLRTLMNEIFHYWTRSVLLPLARSAS